MSNHERVLLAMLQHPPDPNEPLPPANRRATIFGTTLSFLILSSIAVLFRLYVRVRIVREPGWDDVCILVAATLDIIASIFVCLAVDYGGLGHHMLYLKPEAAENYLLYFYVAHAIYITNTAVIKASLLLQFLRIFKAGYMRWTCLGLLALVSLWGLGFSIVAWFPCFPVRGYWQRTTEARCYGFGFSNVDDFVNIYKAHSASNMAFDVAIFLTPLVLFGRPNLKPKSLLAMAGVFAFGGIVVAASIWRLYAISSNQAATYPYYDFTWWSPPMIILSCLEIDLAIMCASMPIFWPIIEKSLTTIFVSYEVKVTEERIDDDYGLAYELEHSRSRREGSMRSTSGTSVEGLTKDEDENKAPKYSVGIDPLSEEANMRFQTSIQSKPRPHWAI
ncbi:hypothetical protein CC86DRAFT_462160 [Ophiobolus disseminans]|uniref:Rhodopsin domain-containing protein n=1 Tax=Ophiobolus disseminans TaxID=1469910 RepID=A0A6A7AL78_9PLEO|nr:hypothetical protein CC86DRAFT_462160 [Ophiobolus disseminans]